MTLTFKHPAVRRSKMLVSTNRNADQTYTNTLLNNGTRVTAGASYSITKKPAGLTGQITVNSTTGEVTFGAAALTKVNADGPQTVTVQAAYKGGTASYTFTLTDHFSKRSAHTSVVMGNDIYVIGGLLKNVGVGPSGGTFIPQERSDEVWRSSDGGLTWDQAASGPRFLPRYAHSSVVSGNDIYVIAGSSGAAGAVAGSRSRDVWKSGNRGVTWQRVTDNAGFQARDGHRSEVLNGKIYVIAGSISTTSTLTTMAKVDDVWESDISTAGGRTWSEATSGSMAKFGARRYPASAVLGTGAAAKLYVIGGDGSTNDFDDVWNSANGATWNQVSVTMAFTPARGSHSLAVLNEGAHRGLYLIGGISGAFLRDVWKSTDGEGKIWTRVTQNAPFGDRADHSSPVQGGALYVIGGTSAAGVFHNDVWKSTNGGLTWVNVHANP